MVFCERNKCRLFTRSKKILPKNLGSSDKHCLHNSYCPSNLSHLKESIGVSHQILRRYSSSLGLSVSLVCFFIHFSMNSLTVFPFLFFYFHSSFSLVLNFITHQPILTPWMEYGSFSSSDINWIEIHTNLKTFSDPIVLITIPINLNFPTTVLSRIKSIQKLNRWNLISNKIISRKW